jgi:hypothetical protein
MRLVHKPQFIFKNKENKLKIIDIGSLIMPET